MITKEMLVKVNNGILTADAINGQTTEDDALIEEVIRIFSQVKTLFKEQPLIGEPISLERQNEILFEANRNIKVRLDASEASRKELKELLTEYGRHSPGCSQEFSSKYHCRCGWSEVETNKQGVEE